MLNSLSKWAIQEPDGPRTSPKQTTQRKHSQRLLLVNHCDRSGSPTTWSTILPCQALVFTAAADSVGTCPPLQRIAQCTPPASCWCISLPAQQPFSAEHRAAQKSQSCHPWSSPLLTTDRRKSADEFSPCCPQGGHVRGVLSAVSRNPPGA